jgi:hypothetical protein
MACCKDAFHVLEDQDVTEFDSDWCFVPLLGEKNKQANSHRVLFPRVRHTLLAMLCADVMYN